MKRKIHYLCVLLCTFAYYVTGYSQINYTESFNGSTAWEINEFEAIDADAGSCDTNGSIRVNVWSFWSYYEEIVSPSIGVSNGMPVTLTYDYKVVNYADEPPFDPASNWGFIKVYYSTSPTGPFSLLQTIDTSNHIVSASCATKTLTFTPPGAQQIYLRVYTEIDTEDTDIWVYLDNFHAVQEAATACSGTPAINSAVAANSMVCNQEQVSLSLAPYNTSLGLTYQWQSSADNITYTNITGATENTYSGSQTASTWYRAITTCTASTSSTTSAPVQVITSGFDCLCNVEFTEDVEPITNVTFASINNTTSNVLNATPGVENFAGSVAPAIVNKGMTYPISLKGNTFGDFEDYFKVYIDFNHNGNFDDAGESFEIGTITESTGIDSEAATGNITIPATALTGLTYMRVFKLFDLYSGSACGGGEDENYDYGQVEDYLLDIQCATLPPVAEANQAYCAGATVTNLIATGTGVKWYAANTGGTALAATEVLVNTTTYYATATSGCESETRTPVTVTILNAVADEFEDVTTCSEYVLPALSANNNYYTGPNGTGTIIEAGEEIDETMTIYVHASVSANTVVCNDDSSFHVTVTPLATPGDITVSIEDSGSMPVAHPLYDIDIEVEYEGTLTYYATEDDAEDGENALGEDETVTTGTTTYYATLTDGECTSEPFTITFDIVLGANHFNMASFSYYPNPVKDILTLSYSENITGIEVVNLVGQKVLLGSYNQDTVEVNLSQLASGTYMVKVSTENASKTIKVIRE